MAESPNILARGLEGFQAGQKLKAERGKRNALSMYAQGDIEGASRAAAEAGDLETSLNIRKIGQEQKAAEARANAMALYDKGDVAGAKSAAAGSGDAETFKFIAELDADKRKVAAEHAEKLGSIMFSLKQRPYEERRLLIPHIAQALAQEGFQPDRIANFDPTDQNLDVGISQAMSLKDQIEWIDKQADNRRADAQLNETQRHNKATEGISAGQLAISRGQLGVAQGNLGVRRQEFQARKAAGGFGTPGSGGVYGQELPPGATLDP